MSLKEKYNSKIEDIIKKFGLHNKTSTSNVGKYILNDPGIVIAELIFRHENNKLKKEGIITYLKENLKLSTDKAEKLEGEIKKEILSTEEKKFTSSQIETPKEKGSDKYREPIE